MKKITLSLLLLNAFFAGAQTLTQSTSQTVLASNTVSCNAGGIASADNSYYRAFNLPTLGITADYAITSVEFGIQTVDNLGTYPIFVKLYATTGTFPTGFPATGYTLLAEQTYEVPDQSQTIFSAPIAATVPVGSKLVVEVGYLADPNAFAFVFLGSNTAGQTAPTYIKAATCTLPNPATMASISFPNVHLVMNVVGTQLSVNQNVLDKVAVYPNPAKDVINFELPANVELQKVYLADVTGKQIMLPTNSLSADISRFAPGVYMLTLETNEGNVTKKVVKN